MTLLAAVLQIVAVLLVVAGAFVLFGIGGALLAAGAGLFGVGFALEARTTV